MYGGYSLLRLLNRANALTPFQAAWFRAGHAHAGVLLLMSLLYYPFLDQTPFSPAIKHAACATLVAGILAQSGGFFIHWSWDSRTDLPSATPSRWLAPSC
jgi:hypothetical protein